MTYNEAIQLDDKITKRSLIGISNYNYPSLNKEDNNCPFFERKENYGLIIDDVDFLKYQIFNADLDYKLPLINGNYYMIFDKTNALKENELKYPICICYTSKLDKRLCFEEEDEEDSYLKEWVIVRNEKEKEQFFKSSKNIFDITYYSIKDDIYIEIYNQLDMIHKVYQKEWNKIVMSPIHLEGDVLITDPCYWVKQDDWGVFEFGNTWKHLGINNSICRDTIYGDWSCHVFNNDTNEILGTFCADSGMVCVCLLDEVKKYSGDTINSYIESGCATVIKKFKGDIQFEIKEDSLFVVGKGNLNFISKQTGF